MSRCDLHHAFLLTTAAASLAERLVVAGFSEGSGRRHEGQGTANRRFFFANFMLELLWIDDADEAGTGDSARLALAGRLGAGACPIGLVCCGDGCRMHDAWSYALAGLPGDERLRVSVDSTMINKPLSVHIPFPLATEPPAEEPARHANGVERLTEVRLLGPQRPDHEPAPLRWESSERWHLRLAFDQERQGRGLQLAPESPLELRW